MRVRWGETYCPRTRELVFQSPRRRGMPANSNTTAGCRYPLWVSDKDDDGTPIDPQFIEAAYALEAILFAYRQREIGCRSTTAELIQDSVNAASRASHLEPIHNARGYLLTTFMRKVDAHLAKCGREIPCSNEFIEYLMARQHDKHSDIESLEQPILMDQAKSYMDAWTRNVCNIKTFGYTMEEIARGFSEPTNRVSVRFCRGMKKAKRLLEIETGCGKDI
jgi:DNA-directed RNA polymerase specialized sigma24 family protein